MSRFGLGCRDLEIVNKTTLENGVLGAIPIMTTAKLVPLGLVKVPTMGWSLVAVLDVSSVWM
jgi:hypothetical protein